MSDADPIIVIKDLVKTYRRGGQELRVLDGLDLTMQRGLFWALMGPSGSGKTTLLNLIGGLDQPDAGSVRVCDEELAHLGGPALASWRAANVGFVFQSFNLIPVLSAQENVELPLQLTKLGGAERRKRARLALELVGLADRASHRPGQLSGGQEQRVAIARAIVTDPNLILADEPTGDLDRDSADSVLELLVRLAKELSKTILMVTHDPHAAERADAVVNLDKGRLGSIQHHERAGRAGA